MSSRAHRILQNCGVNLQISGTTPTTQEEKYAKSSSLRSGSEADAIHQINSPNEIDSTSTSTTYDCEVAANGVVILSITDNALLELVTFDQAPDKFSQSLNALNFETVQHDAESISLDFQGVLENTILSSDQCLQDRCRSNQLTLETEQGYNKEISRDVQEENEIVFRSEGEEAELEREEDNEYHVELQLESENKQHQAEAELEGNENSEYHPEAELESEEDTEYLAEAELESKEDNEYQATKSCTSVKSRKQTSAKRVIGEKYLGYKRSQGKISYNIPRPFKRLRDRGCSHTEQTPKKNGRTFLCGSISETKRQNIFSHFWKELQTWDEKRAFVKGLVAARGIRRRRKNDIPRKPKKKEGYDIYLSKDNGNKVRVCRAFFLSTLDLGEDTFKRWVRNSDYPANYSESEDDQEDDAIKEDEMRLVTEQKKPGSRKRKLTQNQRVNIQNEKRNMKTENVRKWLSLVPKVPSHYCRRSSQKIYVESDFRSVLHMYNVFLEWCKDNNIQPIGRKLFVEVLKQEKIAIHQPRKDQCDTCSSFRIGNINEAAYQAHVEKKDRSRAAKKAAKESASTDKLVITMDLESVLLCPKTLASSMYYKQKLQVHNFTIYELNNANVHLYVWNEVEGGVTANEFTSCIVHYIRNTPDNVKEIVLISDGCVYQNRNKVLTSALSDISKEKQITVEQLYLEKGHTMMEADSVHSVLDHLFKPPINAPSDYVARMRLARPKHPYNVIVVNHDFFLDYDSLPTNFASIRPGKKAGEPTVTDIRQLQYLPNGEINYKLDYNTAEWQPLPQRRPAADRVIPSQLYVNQIPITESKYCHLQELKPVIEREHHAFYDSLPCVPDNKDKKTPSTSAKKPKRKRNNKAANDK